MTDCCYLVGNFLDDTPFSFTDCFISVNNNINTSIVDYGCDDIALGPRLGSLNLSGYVGTDIYTGCPARAGVQVLWARKYICEKDETLFIFLGPGRSYSFNGADEYVTLAKVAEDTTEIITASSQSGPAALFTYAEQLEGIGMSYVRGPINFDTASEAGCTMDNLGMGTGSYYLQNFTLELTPGSIPVASYTFAYNP